MQQTVRYCLLVGFIFFYISQIARCCIGHNSISDLLAGTVFLGVFRTEKRTVIRHMRFFDFCFVENLWDV